jgi:hypothetical protein
MSDLLSVFDSVKDGELQTAKTIVQTVLGSVRYAYVIVNLLRIFKGHESP